MFQRRIFQLPRCLRLDRRRKGPMPKTKFHRDIFPDLPFQNTVVDIETPDKVLGEFTIDGVSGVSNRTIHQRFFVYMVAENGKIKLMRVSLETIAAANALLPGGIEHALKK